MKPDSHQKIFAELGTEESNLLKKAAFLANEAMPNAFFVDFASPMNKANNDPGASWVRGKALFSLISAGYFIQVDKDLVRIREGIRSTIRESLDSQEKDHWIHVCSTILLEMLQQGVDKSLLEPHVLSLKTFALEIGDDLKNQEPLYSKLLPLFDQHDPNLEVTQVKLIGCTRRSTASKMKVFLLNTVPDDQDADFTSLRLEIGGDNQTFETLMDLNKFVTSTRGGYLTTLRFYPRWGEKANVLRVHNGSEFSRIELSNTPEEESPRIKMIAMLPNPNGHDLGRERVVLCNTREEIIPLTGWSIRDRTGREEPLDGHLKGLSATNILLSGKGCILSNRGDHIKLCDPDGAMVDQWKYKASDAKDDQWLIRPFVNLPAHGISKKEKRKESEIPDFDPLELAYRLVAAGRMDPELLINLDAGAISSIVADMIKETTGPGACALALERLSKDQQGLNPDPLWLNWMNHANQEQVSRLRSGLGL